jgi:site-specific recombinase XerD
MALTYEDCRDFMTKMRAGGYSASSLNKFRVYLMNVWRFCDGDNLACPIRKLKREREPEPAPRGQDPTLIRRAIETMEVTATRARTAVLASTGMRPSELMRLGSGDFHLEVARPYVSVRTAKGGQPRLVPLNTDGIAAAKLFIETKAFGSFSRDSLRMSFHRALARVGVVNDVIPPDEPGRGRKVRLWRFTPYVMRHTVATELRRKGTDLADIGYILGHKSLTTTLRYAKVDSDRLHEAMAKLVAFP